MRTSHVGHGFDYVTFTRRDHCNLNLSVNSDFTNPRMVQTVRGFDYDPKRCDCRQRIPFADNAVLVIACGFPEGNPGFAVLAFDGKVADGFGLGTAQGIFAG